MQKRIIVPFIAILFMGCQPPITYENNLNNSPYIESDSLNLRTPLSTNCQKAECVIEANDKVFKWDKTFFGDSYQGTRNVQVYRYSPNSSQPELHEQWAVDIVNKTAGLISSVDLRGNSPPSINLSPQMKGANQWGERTGFVENIIAMVDNSTPESTEAVSIGEARLVKGDFGIKYAEADMKILRPIRTVIVTFGAYDSSGAKVGEFLYSGSNFVQDETVKIKAMGTVPPDVSIAAIKRLKTQVVD
ncbi:FxLYD domain-containing protein [Oscillatoria sp. HE19RPO]|uniref:FxLYD domain-containing protein n=1 Tax=Oscillatoria sp. HE19RPO TaxID=2954806 RepID=UPI0020C34781|nr:FxLYD domain-containing protein [Oscillatoria sp. HE19RPO]